MIINHNFVPSGVLSPSCQWSGGGAWEACGAPVEDHLLDQRGTLRGHAPLLSPEGKFGNGECQYAACGRRRLAAIHGDQKPQYVASEPKTIMVMDADSADVQAQDTLPAVQAWDALAAGVRATIIAKSQGYGNAWQRQGYMGNMARVLSKAARLENLIWRDQQDPPAVQGSEHSMQEDADTESIVDTLVDLAALCAFLRANHEQGNRWGR